MRKKGVAPAHLVAFKTIFGVKPPLIKNDVMIRKVCLKNKPAGTKGSGGLI
jgi:hypothetical protein